MGLQIRRGTEAERLAMGAGDPAVGEQLYITDTDKMWIGDGSTAGGIEVGAAGSGDVIGPTGAVDENLAAFNLATGKVIKDSLIPMGDVSAGITKLAGIEDGAEVNAPTELSLGTKTPTTLAITSDGAVDDVTLPEADTTDAGLLGSDKWDEIVANSLKATNVSTDLSEGTSTETTVDVNSSDGNNATLVAASASRAGLLTKAKFDEIVVNNGKATNVSTDLSEGTATVTTVDVNSSDGNNATLVSASTSRAGLLTKAKFDEVVLNTTHRGLSAAAHGITGSVVGTTDSQTLAAKTLTTPTIGDMTNATHDHADAAGGGTIATGDLDLYEAIQVQMELTVGEEIQYVAPFAMSITGWTMLLDVSGSAQIDVWKDTYANYPPLDGDSIVTPSVTSDTDNQAAGLSIAVAKGDCIIFHVDSATTSELATLALTGVRT